MSAPRVSVLLPVRDGARFLREALDSVLAQTLADFELLVVDDGSTDETPEILASVGDERLRVLRQEPAGLVAALERGIGEARAPYLARMDADDVSLPCRLERQVAFLDEQSQVALVVPGVESIDEAGRPGRRRRSASRTSARVSTGSPSRPSAPRSAGSRHSSSRSRSRLATRSSTRLRVTAPSCSR